jgi:hypothetical protein
VKLVGEDSEYRQDAVDRFRQLCDGRKLVANVDHKEGPTLHLRLIDPARPSDGRRSPCVNQRGPGPRRSRFGRPKGVQVPLFVPASAEEAPGGGLWSEARPVWDVRVW